MTRFAVRVTPRGGADRVEGVNSYGELRVRVRAAPADGEANEGLLRTLAEALDVPRSDLRLERGGGARTKLIAVDGVEASALTSRWPGLRIDTG